MNLYKAVLNPTSSQITPWHSDTLFGSLSWSIAQTKGEEVLKKFLGEYIKGEYPLVLSNGFINDLLPRPLAGNVKEIKNISNKTEELKLAMEAKKTKKVNFLSLDEFNTIINNGYVDLKAKEKLIKDIVISHNQVSRKNDTTEDGALFEQYETFYDNAYISIYFLVQDNWKNCIFDVFEHLSIRGFGKALSKGKGSFKIRSIEQFKDFNVPKDANSYVVLSNYIPKANESTEGQYKSFVKYGKLGYDFATEGYPFKKPILMFTPGSVFWEETPRFSYGRLVENISSKYKEVVHSGCALAIPAKLQNPFDIL